MSYTVTNCGETDAEFICRKLVEYSLSKVPPTRELLFEKLDRKIEDESGSVIAGCIAKIYCWNTVYVDILWVDEEHRGEGLGSQLLSEIEVLAKAKGCTLIHLDTFDFQAKDFYLAHGYELFGTLEDCPQGHCRFYMKKQL